MRKTVLVVDDAGVARQMNALTLAREGFDVIESVNGREALSKIQGRKIDLVVTDINMPEMDGIEFIKQLRGMDEHKFTPVIVITTLSQEEKVKEGREAGASGWIYKPFLPKQLIETVRKFLS